MAGEEEKEVDFVSMAKKAGYEVVPKNDFDSIRKDSNSLKDFRSKIPQEFQDKPEEFFSTAVQALSRINEIENQNKSDIEKVTGEITSLKGNLTKVSNERDNLKSQLETQKKQTDRLMVIGHVMKGQQVRNVSVDDAFIPDSAIDSFDLSRFDTANPEGMKGLDEAVWNEILEPAHKKQEEVISRVSGKRHTDNGNKPANNDPPVSIWGSKA